MINRRLGVTLLVICLLSAMLFGIKLTAPGASHDLSSAVSDTSHGLRPNPPHRRTAETASSSPSETNSHNPPPREPETAVEAELRTQEVFMCVKSVPSMDPIGSEYSALSREGTFSDGPPAKSNSDLIREPSRFIIPELPHSRLTPESVASALRSDVGKTCQGGARGDVVLATRVRLGITSVRTLQEWILWSRIVGFSHIYVFVDKLPPANESTMAEPAASVWRDFKKHVVDAFPPSVTRVRVLQDTFAVLSAQAYSQHVASNPAASATGFWYGASVAPDEFLIHPGQSVRCASDFFSATAAQEVGAPAIVAVPWAEVGHNNDFNGKARTHLDRTFFGMGDVSHDGGPSLARSTVFYRCCGFRGAQRAGSAHWFDGRATFPISSAPPESVSATARVLKLTVRGLGPHLFDAVHRCNSTFSFIREKAKWQQHRKVGFIDIPEYNERLRGQYAALVAGLGYSGYRRERIGNARSAPFFGAVMRLLKTYIEPPGVPPSEMTDAALTSGKIWLTPEKLLNPLSPSKLRDIARRSPCWSPDLVTKRRSNITFCGYVRNRAKLTAEWVIWHHILGVTNFRIYDDDSNDNLEGVLQPLIDAGLVTLHKAPLPPYRFIKHPVGGGLLAAYGDCTLRELSEGAHDSTVSLMAKYVGFVDPDEFIVLREGICIPEWVDRAVARDPSRNGAVAIPWRDVGHNGEAYDDFLTQFDRTQFAMGKSDHIERVKCIVRADLAVAMDTAHTTTLKPPFYTVFHDGARLPGEGWWSGVKENSPVYANGFILHYHARSFTSWVQRQLDGFADADNKVWEFSTEVTLQWWRGGFRTGYDGQPYKFNDTVGIHEKYLLLRETLQP